MVKQQVYIEGSTINNQGYLTANKGEAAAEFKEQVTQVGEQSSFQLPLREWLSEGQEVEIGVSGAVERKTGLSSAR
jgi:hypothetical protein